MWPVWAWIMVGFGIAVTAAAIVGGVFGRNLVLDFVSFWPGLVLTFLVAAALYPLHRGRFGRLAAVLPLLLLSWLASTIALYTAGWNALPSSAGDLTGPPTGSVTAVDLRVENGGSLVIELSDQDEIYRLRLQRTGGEVAAPQAIERVGPASAQLTIGEREPDRWFVTAGWDLSLSSRVEWALVLAAAEILADLRDASLTSLEVAGSASIMLPAVESGTPLLVDGEVELSIPSGTPMVVSRRPGVEVPAGWIESESGWSSPADGSGYVVTPVEGASLTVTER
jgi:hypothetical protein